MTNSEGNPIVHLGQKVRRVREVRNIKQEYVAAKLGVTQQQVSKIEAQEKIEEELLNQLAEILGVTPEMIKNFDEDKAIYNINFYDIHENEIKDYASNIFIAHQVQYNSSDRGHERALLDKINELYERLLQHDRDKEKSKVE